MDLVDKRNYNNALIPSMTIASYVLKFLKT